MKNKNNLDNEMANCFVNDVLGEKLKIVFILESPDIEEVKKGVPAVGRAGKAMTRHLFHWNTNEKIVGIGSLVKQNKGIATYLGIVNVSNYPLQSQIITDYIRTSIKSVSRLQNIKNNKNIKPGIDADKCASLTKKFELHFQNRLKDLLKNHPEIIFIPCGTFAKSFWEAFLINHLSVNSQKQSISPDWSHNIPHPSFGHWDKNKNNIVGNMISNLNEKIIADKG